MNVLFAASEGSPFYKTGGLADVIGALPKALKAHDIKASVVLPKYEGLSQDTLDRLEFVTAITVPVGWRRQYCGILTLMENGVRYYFLDNEYYFKRPGHYGYYDDGERFAFYSRAVLEALPYLEDMPDVLHLHDWHAGPISVLLESHFRTRQGYDHIKTVFTIHNLQYQGIYPKGVLSDLLDLSDLYFHMDGLEYQGNVSYMKAGLAYSSALTTVSPSYAEEIKTPYYGEGLDGFLRHRGGELHGILNGLDNDLYNPETDEALESPFSLGTFEKKSENKAALQAAAGLPVRDDVLLIGLVTRLANQKGIDLILHVLTDLLRLDVQIVLLGTGEPGYEEAVRYWARTRPEQVSANLFFNDTLARQIYAGSDLFLMPSKFEPCGIGQLIAMRYGSLPVVRETGGLKDTVQPYNRFTGEGHGFSFLNYNAHDMLHVIEEAYGLFKNDRETWDTMARRAMGLDFSWHRSAAAYAKLYTSLI